MTRNLALQRWFNGVSDDTGGFDQWQRATRASDPEADVRSARTVSA